VLGAGLALANNDPGLSVAGEPQGTPASVLRTAEENVEPGWCDDCSGPCTGGAYCDGTCSGPCGTGECQGYCTGPNEAGFACDGSGNCQGAAARGVGRGCGSRFGTATAPACGSCYEGNTYAIPGDAADSQVNT
ncbi:MAG: hypothetical protein JXA58_02830, partial [Dehalococcoidia bacterium]|nr:hypothetical protein [Dehalococcoidia bacterium]